MACLSFAIIGEALRPLVHYNGSFEQRLSGIGDIMACGALIPSPSNRYCPAIAPWILRR
jgi:hypothetical protein